MVDKLPGNKELSSVWRQDWAVVHAPFRSTMTIRRLFGKSVKNVLTINKWIHFQGREIQDSASFPSLWQKKLTEEGHDDNPLASGHCLSSLVSQSGTLSGTLSPGLSGRKACSVQAIAWTSFHRSLTTTRWSPFSRRKIYGSKKVKQIPWGGKWN